MNRTTKPKGIGISAITALLAALLIAAVIAPAMGAVEDTAEGDAGVRDTVNLGSLFTDGKNEIASATCVGPVTVPSGYNTFTATWQNINDVDNDGRGATYKLTVWDAAGIAHTTTKSVDRAGSGTISVSFNSQGAGDAQYELYCDTHTWFNIKASDNCVEDLDYT